jgi:hypothetical protein
MLSLSSLSAWVLHSRTHIDPMSSCLQQLWGCCVDVVDVGGAIPPILTVCHRHAILALLLALAVTLLARHCPALASLGLITISTHNPPYKQGLIGLGQVQPHSFLSLSPPHCRCSPLFPIPIPVVPCFCPMSSHGGSWCGGVAVISWMSTPHIPAITTKENISYLRKQYLVPSFPPTRGCVWVAKCQPPLLTIVYTLNHKEKHLVSKEKQETKHRKHTSSANNSYCHSHLLMGVCQGLQCI